MPSAFRPDLITEQYREQQRMLHDLRSDYGTSGQARAADVLNIAGAIGATTILDYGCGKGTLGTIVTAASPHINWSNYDPGIDEHSALPDRADLVVCTDVLEHIEPELLGSVLDHIQQLAIKAVFLVVHTGPAEKTLPDGRNAHLIQKEPPWWLQMIGERWRILGILYSPPDLIIWGTEVPAPEWTSPNITIKGPNSPEQFLLERRNRPSWFARLPRKIKKIVSKLIGSTSPQ